MHCRISIQIIPVLSRYHKEIKFMFHYQCLREFQRMSAQPPFVSNHIPHVNGKNILNCNMSAVIKLPWKMINYYLYWNCYFEIREISNCLMLSLYIRETAELKHNFWTEPRHSCSKCTILVGQVFYLCSSSHGCVPSTPFYLRSGELSRDWGSAQQGQVWLGSGWCFLKPLSVPSTCSVSGA